MKFIDEAIITVQSGDGGRGCVSFRREKHIPRGGPDGGNGGNGGNIFFLTSPRKRTLQQFRYKQLFKAQNGTHGLGKDKTGKNGSDLYIELPPGTVVSDHLSEEVLTDLAQPEQTFLIAQGGRGGMGNHHFKSSTHRSPRFAQPGEPGQTLKLKLELKLLADVGLIGLPNAGKSTLISVMSAARPKIADYPFTTLTPNLGVVSVGSEASFVVADIPGLIAGAHQGAGLGIRFLKHVERTHVLVHLIDAATIDPQDPLAAFTTVKQELTSYSANLATKPQLVVLTKMDLPDTDAAAECFAKAIREKSFNILTISAVTGLGIDRLKSEIMQILDDTDQRPISFDH